MTFDRAARWSFWLSALLLSLSLAAFAVSNFFEHGTGPWVVFDDAGLIVLRTALVLLSIALLLGLASLARRTVVWLAARAK